MLPWLDSTLRASVGELPLASRSLRNCRTAGTVSLVRSVLPSGLSRAYGRDHLREGRAGHPGQSWTSSIRCAHVCTMSDNAPPAGWVVQIVIPGERSLERSPSGYLSALLGAPTFKYFNVAAATAEAAMAATTKHLADPERRETSVVRALSTAEIAVLDLTAGEVKPA
jgi:hypothetical protein